MANIKITRISRIKHSGQHKNNQDIQDKKIVANIKKGDRMKIGYVRVSSVDQNEERQLVTMKKHEVEKIFIEKVSGKDKNRPKLQELLDYVREGDTVIIHDLSRLARNTKDLLEIVEYFNKNEVALVSDKEYIDSNTATGKLMLTMIAAINEFERANLLERQREGIALAKAKGKYKGRKKIKIDNLDEYYEKYRIRMISKSEMARQLKISRPTLDKLLKEYEMKHISNS